MPFIPYKTEGLSTMQEAAKLVGLSQKKFWRLVREKQLVDAPATQIGRREYYSQEQLQAVIQQVAELRRKGVVR